MNPDQVEALDDDVFDAMIRHIQKEADHYRAQAAKTKLPG